MHEKTVFPSRMLSQPSVALWLDQAMKIRKSVVHPAGTGEAGCTGACVLVEADSPTWSMHGVHGGQERPSLAREGKALPRA